MKTLLTILLLSLILATTCAIILFRQSYEQVDWQKPVSLHRTSPEGIGLIGSWTGKSYYIHDCGRGCETRERIQLDIYPDSSAMLIILIDTLHVIEVPFIGITYARPSLWRVYADEAIIQEDRLVMRWDTAAVDSFTVRGDSLFFNYLDSSILAFR